MTVENKKVMVVGLGKSGMAAFELLEKMQAHVCLYDGREDLDTSEYKVPVYLGDIPDDVLDTLSLAVFSPGVPLDIPPAEKLKQHQIPIIGEIELAFLNEKGTVAAITGTNGKTTTTTLAGEIMKAYREQTFVVGNIGSPYTKEVEQTAEASFTVAEISSFQLETIMDFRPQVSAILNITPDHLNRHGTMERYIGVKKSIAVNQTESDTIVLNYDAPVLREFGLKKKVEEGFGQEFPLKAKVLFFSSREKLDEGLFLEGDEIILKEGEQREVVVNVHDLKLLGRHNYENVMAAVGICLTLGVPLASIRKTVTAFEAVEHRIEFVMERSGVKYYNDSKGTNPDAAIQAINAMPGPTLLIAGGYDKNNEYDEWIEAFGTKVKYLVLIGQTRDKIAQCAREHGFTEIMYAEDMQEAVKVCASYANMGENVLLSPACASWGMFKDYEERGRIFKECVRNL